MGETGQPEKGRKRVGLMGGTFDPIHLGHLMVAECAYEQLQLDRVLFLPTGNPPHKAGRQGGATDRERLEMVRLSIADNPHFALDPEEMYREGVTYTRDTLQLLTGKHPDTDYYFLIGADSLLSFDTWQDPEGICRRCRLAVAVRDRMGRKELEEKMEELRQRFGARIDLLLTPDVEISSSRLRAMRRMGRSIRYFVTDEVLDYIRENRIYME